MKTERRPGWKLPVWGLLLFAACLLPATWIGCGDPKPTEVTQETPATEAVTEAKVDAGPVDAVAEAAPDAAPEPRSEPLPDAVPEATPEPTPEPVVEAVAEQTPEAAPELSPDAPKVKTKVAMIANSDFVNGSYSLMSIADRKKLIESKQIKVAGDISGDIVIRKQGRWLILLNRFNDATKQDRVDVIDLETLGINQIQLDPKANPHDAVIVDQKRLYVTQYGKKEMIVFEENKSPVMIDLSSLAEVSAKACTEDSECTKFGEGSGKCDKTGGVCESDGLPEMSSMILHNDKIYVAIQGLDRNDGFTPVKSVLAVIDTKTDTLVKNLSLKGSNPTGFIKEPAGTYLVIEANSSFDATDGGLERFDPATETLSGTYTLTEQEAGGSFSFSSAVVVSATLGYFIVNDASFNQDLIQFDPSTGKLIKTLLQGKKLSDIALNDQGELYLGDKGDDMGVGKGVRIFEAATGKELTTQPIVVADSLPPSQFVFGEIDISVLPKP